MDKKEMIEWLYLLSDACEDMELVKANFEDYKKPHHMTAHKLIHEIIGALEDISAGMWRKDVDNNRDMFDKVRWYCPVCDSWQTYGEPKYCPNCGARVMSNQEREESEQNE